MAVMAQQVRMKWERQGKEREGGDWGKASAELIGLGHAALGHAHHEPWEAHVGLLRERMAGVRGMICRGPKEWRGHGDDMEDQD